MKKIRIVTIAIYLLSIASSQAQNVERRGDDVKTLFGNGGGIGGFIEAKVKAGEINGQASLLTGGTVAAVFSHRINIGFTGYGLATNVDADTYDENNELYELGMGYGGLLIEPVIANKEVVHITIPIILGVGGAILREDLAEPWTRDFENELRNYDEDAFLVAEPGMNIEVNLFRHLRLDLGASYRYVYDSNIEGISDDEMSGFTISSSLKFGWF